MSWKKYKDKTPEEKKAGWARFKSSQMIKKMQSKTKEKTHPPDHKFSPNSGGYCTECGHGRDHS